MGYSSATSVQTALFLRIHCLKVSYKFCLVAQLQSNFKWNTIIVFLVEKKQQECLKFFQAGLTFSDVSPRRPSKFYWATSQRYTSVGFINHTKAKNRGSPGYSRNLFSKVHDMQKEALYYYYIRK